MEHRVRFVDDNLVPEGRNWIMCERDGVTTLFIRRSAQDLPEREKEIALEAAWQGFMDLAALSSVG